MHVKLIFHVSVSSARAFYVLSTCTARVTLVVLCVCVCVSVCVFAFSTLPSHGFRCQMRGISGYGMEIYVKLKSSFL